MDANNLISHREEITVPQRLASPRPPPPQEEKEKDTTIEDRMSIIINSPSSSTSLSPKMKPYVPTPLQEVNLKQITDRVFQQHRSSQLRLSLQSAHSRVNLFSQEEPNQDSFSASLAYQLRQQKRLGCLKHGGASPRLHAATLTEAELRAKNIEERVLQEQKNASHSTQMVKELFEGKVEHLEKMQKQLQEEMKQMQSSLSTFTERIEVALNANITANNFFPQSRSNSPPLYLDSVSSDTPRIGLNSGSDHSDHETKSRTSFTQRPNRPKRIHRAPTLRDRFTDETIERSPSVISQEALSVKNRVSAPRGLNLGQDNRRPSLFSCQKLDRHQARFPSLLKDKEKASQKPTSTFSRKSPEELKKKEKLPSKFKDKAMTSTFKNPLQRMSQDLSKSLESIQSQKKQGLENRNEIKSSRASYESRSPLVKGEPNNNNPYH